LKKWIDGEEFDTCALIDYAIDKKAGMIPSDRLLRIYGTLTRQ